MYTNGVIPAGRKHEKQLAPFVFIALVSALEGLSFELLETEATPADVEVARRTVTALLAKVLDVPGPPLCDDAATCGDTRQAPVAAITAKPAAGHGAAPHAPPAGHVSPKASAAASAGPVVAAAAPSASAKKK
ncbi:MAG: hypothetical protein ABIP39_12095 [Polyangiaceae bacterium]